MGTYTPNTALLVAHLVTQLQTIVTPTWRTNIGSNVSSEREQALDSEAPLCSVRIAGWESINEGVAVRRDCDIVIEALVAAGAENAEAQALLVAEDLFERFRTAGGVTLASGVECVIRPVERAEIERPDSAGSVLVRVSLIAELYEVP